MPPESLDPSNLERQVTQWATDQVGAVVVVADRSRQRHRALVLELESVDGRRWFAKRPMERVNFDRELAAYRRLLPRVAAPTPALRAASAEQGVILISHLPGRGAEEDDLVHSVDVHRRAGEWLARLHASSPPVPAPRLGEVLGERLTGLGARLAGLLDRPTLDYTADIAARLSGLGGLITVPCHLDYSQRNWLVTDEGQLGVIDFATTEYAVAAQDFARLANREWSLRPHLRDAFFDGYGRALDAAEEEHLECCTALVAASSLVRSGYRSRAVADQSRHTLRRLHEAAQRRAG